MRQAALVGVLLALFLAVLLLSDCRIFDGEGGSQRTAASMFIKATAAPSLDRFRADVGRFPTTEEGLRALVVCPTGLESVWKGPYIETKGERLPIDPWGGEFLYRFPAVRSSKGYDLWSYALDGVESGDDVGNW